MNENKTVAERLTARYFKSFPKLLILNILFAVPTVASLCIVYFCNIKNIFLSALFLILLFPFYIGACECIRKLVTKKPLSIIKDFLKGVKDNFFKSLLSGLFLYLSFIVLYASFSLYYTAANQNALFWIFFAATVPLALLVIFFFMSVSVMTVSFELTASQILKNSLLAMLGELKHNLAALLAGVVLSTICGVLIIAMQNFFAAVALILLILPSSFSFITFFFLYESMEKTVAGKSSNDTPPPPATNTITEDDAAFLQQKVQRGCEDEYIFHNGKMIKRSELNRMYDKQE